MKQNTIDMIWRVINARVISSTKKRNHIVVRVASLYDDVSNNEGSKIMYKTRYQAKKENPGAAKVVKVEGGYKVFAFYSDYLTWKNQK